MTGKTIYAGKEAGHHTQTLLIHSRSADITHVSWNSVHTKLPPQKSSNSRNALKVTYYSSKHAA